MEDLSNSKHIELEELQKSSLKVELSVLSNEKDALLQKNAVSKFIFPFYLIFFLK